jgi:hypothetical protein
VYHTGGKLGRIGSADGGLWCDLHSVRPLSLSVSCPYLGSGHPMKKDFTHDKHASSIPWGCMLG